MVSFSFAGHDTVGNIYLLIYDVCKKRVSKEITGEVHNLTNHEIEILHIKILNGYHL